MGSRLPLDFVPSIQGGAVLTDISHTPGVYLPSRWTVDKVEHYVTHLEAPSPQAQEHQVTMQWLPRVVQLLRDGVLSFGAAAWILMPNIFAQHRLGYKRFNSSIITLPAALDSLE